MPKNCSIPAIALGLLFPLVALAQLPGGATVKLDTGAGGPSAPGGFSLPGLVKDEPPTDAEKTLDAAIARLKSLVSFSADIAQNVDMLNQKFDVKGTFLRASNHRVYLKLAVSGLGDTPATTLQVCDGTTLWDYQQVLESQNYRKLTITAIFKKLDDPVLDAPFREQVVARLGFAGPETMLTGLRKAVRFDQKADDTLNGKKTWVIRGQWKDRAGLTAPGQQPLPPTMPLPSYIPSNVAIWIGQDDGWPYKIEMVGNAPSKLVQDNRRVGPDGRPMGAKVPAPKVDPSRITLLYSNVKLNPEIPPAAFAFQAPPDAKGVVDSTDEFLAFLDQAIQGATMQKKAEAAKAEPLIPSAIDVPKTIIPSPTTPAPAPTPGPDAPGAPK